LRAALDLGRVQRPRRARGLDAEPPATLVQTEVRLGEESGVAVVARLFGSRSPPVWPFRWPRAPTDRTESSSSCSRR
ncbi:MAG: hypothetical protein ACRCXL_04715, partial [Dermatophilaceae bacterium]